MKNENHPLISALKARQAPRPMIEASEPSRHFEVNTNEMPHLKNAKPGEPFQAHLHGHITSMHADGRVMVAVHKVVKPDTEAMDKQEDPNLQQPHIVHVRTQQSNVG